ncbi:hypothetical protein PAMP_019448 [Pampus punctatissimus]
MAIASYLERYLLTASHSHPTAVPPYLSVQINFFPPSFPPCIYSSSQDKISQAKASSQFAYTPSFTVGWSMESMTPPTGNAGKEPKQIPFHGVYKWRG